MRKPAILLLSALVLAAFAWVARDSAPQARLEKAASALQDRVNTAGEDLMAQTRHAAEADSLDMDAEHVRGEGGLRLYRNGEVVAWTDHAPIADAALDTARAGHLVLKDGIYLHAFAQQGGAQVHGVRRVWFQPPFENQYLQRQLDPGFAIAKGVGVVGADVPGVMVKDPAGQPMLKLGWSADPPLPGTGLYLSMLFALLAAALALGAWWQLARRMQGGIRQVACFLAVLAVARVASLWAGTPVAWAAVPLFDPSLFASSLAMPSLGDLLINAALALCAAFFIRATIFEVPARTIRVVRPVLLLVLFLFAAGIHGVLYALVHDSSVNLDLFRVQGFNIYSLAALLAIGILLLAWCLVADRLMGGNAPPTTKAVLVAGLLLTLVLALYRHSQGQYDLMPVAWPLPALLLVRRIRARSSALASLLLVALLALFTAHSLNRQTFKRVEMERETIAENATAMEDPVIELLFDEARSEMMRNRQLLAWAGNRVACNSAELDRTVRQVYFPGYWDRYDLRLHLVDPVTGFYCTTSPDAGTNGKTVSARFEQGVPTVGHGYLRITGRLGEDALYMGQVPLGELMLYVELRPRLISDGLGFPELLLAGQRPVLAGQERYSRARYERGILTASTGTFTFPIAWHKAVPEDGLRWTQLGYDLLAVGHPHRAVVVLAMRIPGRWDHVTTFSYLFLFYCLLAGLFGLVRLLLRGRMATMGVSGKVRAGVAGFALTGLVLFTFGMQRMIDMRQQQRNTRQLTELARGVIAELRQSLRGQETMPDSMAPQLNHVLMGLSNVFFTDLSLYDPDGKLFATSREQVFNTGLLGPRMDPRAYHQLALEGLASYIGKEHIGNAEFSTAYMPYRSEQGHVLAYLALPYFARQAEVDAERATGYVALVNLFTLLFLLSVVAAALIAHWTTRPLELLRSGLERIGLGARNEPILYQGNDELGQLVRVYNRKVDELRESAMKLARSERESAWREMAKQVAHEIKNPLTPMKLNIQLFQRTWRPDMPDAKERLDKFSQGLVEQIDTLSRIAGEFSDFAKMPHARPEPVDLHAVALAAVALFAAEPHAEVVLHPGTALPVLADREQLMRVFTNLIKNALQAIPEGRTGRVELFTSVREGSAMAEVRDNGTGIAKADRERIFQPNFTTKGSGMGLGLAMVQRMVENAGGRVWFETEEGKGTSFFIALPMTRPQDGPR